MAIIIKSICEDCGESYVSFISGSKDYGYRHLNCPVRAAKAVAAAYDCNNGNDCPDPGVCHAIGACDLANA